MKRTSDETQPEDYENEFITGKVVPFERDIDYYIEKGHNYYLQNNFFKALVFFKKAFELKPEDPLHHYNLGCLLSKMGHLQEANNIFCNVIDNMDDTYWDCYFLMAVNYGMLDEREKAVDCLKHYLLKVPGAELIREARELLDVLTIDDRFPDNSFNSISVDNEQVFEDIHEILSAMNNEDYIFDEEICRNILKHIILPDSHE